MTKSAELGWIAKAEVGFFDSAYRGDPVLILNFKGNSWGVQITEPIDRVLPTLKDAEKFEVSSLRGCPVEVYFENRTIQSWRVLTEVIPK